jgi:hypothetical protein
VPKNLQNPEKKKTNHKIDPDLQFKLVIFGHVLVNCRQWTLAGHLTQIVPYIFLKQQEKKTQPHQTKNGLLF